MSKKEQENPREEPTSVRFWMIAILLAWLPCVGVVFVLLSAFIGKNTTRKNYFKAVLWWYFIGILFFIGLFLWGAFPAIREAFLNFTSSWEFK
jgi:hypothetical protein